MEGVKYAFTAPATDWFPLLQSIHWYAVIIFKNGCEVTSSCVSVTNVGINSLNRGREFNIYPNPGHDKIKIEIPEAFRHLGTELKVYDCVGRILKNQPLSNSEFIIVDVFDLSNGIYFIELISDKQMSKSIFVKQ